MKRQTTRQPSRFSGFSKVPRYRSWFFFLFFLAANSWLSFGVLSLEAKVWTLILGVILPGVLALFLLKDPEGTPRPSLEGALPPPSPAVWILFAALMAGAYFFKLTSFPSWLLPDEGRFAYFSLDVAHQGDGRMLWGESQAPPLSFWLFGSLFKLFPVSFAVLRVIPAVLSLLTVLAAYFLLRRSFPGAFVFLFLWLLALSFWFFSLSRYFMFMGLFVLIEFLALGALLLFLNTARSGDRLKTILLMSLAVSAGYYTAVIGKNLLAVVTLTLLFHAFGGRKKEARYFFLFLLVCGGAILPMVLAEAAPGGLGYILSHFKAGLNFSYLAALFWGGQNSAPYGPAWGGCFNPILGSLVFVGALGLFRARKFLLAGWLAAALLLFSLPGLLSGDMEIYRVLGVLPLFVWLAAYGLNGLAGEFPRRVRWPAVWGLLLCSSAMDVHHYTGPYQDHPGLQKGWVNAGFKKVYEVMELEKEKGIHLGFLDFTTITDDQTLNLCVRPFDVFQDPGLEDRAPREVALIANPNYEPFLQKRFPRGKWTWVSEKTSEKQDLVLGLIPLDAAAQKTLMDWREASQVLRRLKALYMYRKPLESYQPVLEFLVKHSPVFEKDPFLRSIYWEQMGFAFIAQRDLPSAQASYEKAVERGVPAAHFFNNIGVALALQGRAQEAAMAFQKAMAAPVDRTGARERLQALRLGGI